MTATMQQHGNGSAGHMTRPVSDDRLMEYVPFGGAAKIKLSVKIVQDMVCVPTKSGKKCDDVQAMKFMMLCRARGLNPFEGDAYLIGYEGRDGKATFSLITSHQAFLKRAEQHPEFDGMESGVIVADQDGNIVDREGDFFFDTDFLLGGWATVYFKNRTHPMRKRVKLATFHKGFGQWNDNPAGMICKCAEADALRSSFPTLLGGLYAPEETREAVEPVQDVEPVQMTTGRQKIGGTRPKPAAKRPAETQQPVNEETIEAATETFPPADEADQGDANEDGQPSEEASRTIMDIGDAIDACETTAALSKAGAALKEALPLIGEEAHQGLLKRWQDKYQALSKKK